MAYLAASSLSWPLIRETIQLISKQSGHPSPRGGGGSFQGGAGIGRGWVWRPVCAAPDYPPPPDFLHQITSTSWTDLKILQNSTVLYQEEVVGGLLAIKLIPLIGQTVQLQKGWWQILMIRSDPTEAAKIRSKNTLRFLAISSLATDLPFVAPRNIFMCSNCMFCTQKEC